MAIFQNKILKAYILYIFVDFIHKEYDYVFEIVIIENKEFMRQVVIQCIVLQVQINLNEDKLFDIIL